MSTDSVSDKIRGQVAIVTGAGRGVGRAIALALRRAGARVGLGPGIRGRKEVAAVVPEAIRPGAARAR